MKNMFSGSMAPDTSSITINPRGNDPETVSETVVIAADLVPSPMVVPSHGNKRRRVSWDVAVLYRVC